MQLSIDWIRFLDKRKKIDSYSRIFMDYYKSLPTKWDHLFWFMKIFLIWGMLLTRVVVCLGWELKVDEVIGEHTKLRICLPKGDYFFVYADGLTHLR